jgi:hypothetical protein
VCRSSINWGVRCAERKSGQQALFSYVAIEARIPTDHRVLLLQVLYTVRSERQLIEQCARTLKFPQLVNTQVPARAA